MSARTKTNVTVKLALLALAAALLASPAARAAAKGMPKLVNANVDTRSASAGLEPAVRAFVAAQESPAWVGYAVPMIGGEREMCCWNGSHDAGKCCGRCSLESSNESWGQTDAHCDSHASGGTRHLEGMSPLIVLMRVVDHRIGRVRTFTEECTVDAGGLRVLWLTDVKPAESVAVLSSLIAPASFDDHDYRSAASGALSAIAMHADPAADRAFTSFITPSQPEKLRSQAAFWLGSVRGEPGLHLLEGMAKSDPSTKVREQVAFAYSVNGQSAAIDDLIRMAKEDESSKVRSQALFWLGQKAGNRAAKALTDAIDNDPDTGTKKQAVFALSQLPKEQGVPLLIQVAKTNKNAEVRKQAFFWLGQSQDPRALDFFEEVLKR